MLRLLFARLKTKSPLRKNIAEDEYYPWYHLNWFSLSPRKMLSLDPFAVTGVPVLPYSTFGQTARKCIQIHLFLCLAPTDNSLEEIRRILLLFVNAFYYVLYFITFLC